MSFSSQLNLFYFAAKQLKYVFQAGALRWLMRSGDADRIATFAAASRDRSTQLMAADYLRRRAPWRARPDLARHILHFYTRAKAHGKLAAFYAECAKMEIDDYEVRFRSKASFVLRVGLLVG